MFTFPVGIAPYLDVDILADDVAQIGSAIGAFKESLVFHSLEVTAYGFAADVEEFAQHGH